MINVKEQKVYEAIQGMHEAIVRKAKRGQVKEDIIMENRLFSIICQDFDLGPMKCAQAMNEKYGYDLSGNDIIQIFRSRRMANPVERRELFCWAEEVASYFPKAISGDKNSFEKYEKKRKEPSLKNGKNHDSQERIAAIMIYEKHPEIDLFDDAQSLSFLGNTLSKYFFYDISDAISEAYGFPQYRDSKEVKEAKKKNQNQKQENKLSYEQALQKIEHLESKLERTNTMLQDLQEEFEEQLEASKSKELADFFARLNSERYGCILDELLVIRKGVDALRKSHYELPIEVNGLFIMVKKLIQFVRDSHIEPIMKMNAVQEALAADVEFCNYEGTPFADPQQKKKVRVVSPGWVYKDKELQISRPKVKEEE